MLSKTLNKKNLRNICLALLYLSLPLFLLLTNPQNLPLPLLIMPVVLLFVIIYTTVYLAIFKKYKRLNKLSKTRIYVISGISALIPVLLIVLASIGQFTLRDIVLALVIVVCISWYLLKVDFLKTD